MVCAFQCLLGETFIVINLLVLLGPVCLSDTACVLQGGLNLSLGTMFIEYLQIMVLECKHPHVFNHTAPGLKQGFPIALKLLICVDTAFTR